MAATMTTTQSMATTPTKSSSSSSATSAAAQSASSKQMQPDYLSAKALLDRYSASTSSASSPIRRKMAEDETQAEIDLCRTQGQSCGSIQDLLESFHTAFSDDQLWAIVFQFITLYRNAIILNCRSSSRASSSTTGATTQKQDNSPRRKTKGSSAVNLVEKNKMQNKKSVNLVQKLNLSMEGSTGTSGRGSDSECGCSDVEASDNSDIISELMMMEQEESDNSATMISRNGGGKSSSVSSSRAIDDNRGGNNNNNDSSGSDEDDQYTEGEEEEDKDLKDQRRRRRSSRNVGLAGEKPSSRCMEHHVDYLNVPTSLRNFRIHKDGSVHVSYADEGEEKSSYKNCRRCYKPSNSFDLSWILR